MPPKNIKNGARKAKSIANAIPLPVLLSNSSEIAEKYDNYLRMLCKSYPSTMRSLRSEKKMIEDKKDDLRSHIEKIRLDIREMQTAALQLDILYEKEFEFEQEKQKEIKQLNDLIRLAQERKVVMENFITKYTKARNFLADISTANKFTNVRELVEYYLALETLNEQFIQQEFQAMVNDISSQNINLELLLDLKNHQYELVKRKKMLEDVSHQSHVVQDNNSIMKEKLNGLVEAQREDLRNWEALNRWSNDMCKLISPYKDTPVQSKDLSKQLEEINDFITAAKKIAKQ